MTFENVLPSTCHRTMATIPQTNTPMRFVQYPHFMDEETGLGRASKVTELVRCQSQDTNAGPSDSQVCEILAISGNMCILLNPGRHNGRIPGSLSSLKYGTLCAQSPFLGPQGHPLPALCSALVFSGNGLASLVLQNDTGLQLCPFSLLLPAGADQGMRKTSPPAGMAASLSLLNSTQDM